MSSLFRTPLDQGLREHETEEFFGNLWGTPTMSGEPNCGQWLELCSKQLPVLSEILTAFSASRSKQVKKSKPTEALGWTRWKDGLSADGLVGTPVRATQSPYKNTHGDPSFGQVECGMFFSQKFPTSSKITSNVKVREDEILHPSSSILPTSTHSVT